MSWNLIGMALLTVLGLACGQVLFKLAALHLKNDEPLWLSAIHNGYLWIALAVYGVATILWILLLRHAPLRLAYPLVGLAFVIVPFLAHWWLDEPLRWQSLAGAALIMSGIIISIK